MNYTGTVSGRTFLLFRACLGGDGQRLFAPTAAAFQYFPLRKSFAATVRDELALLLQVLGRMEAKSKTILVVEDDEAVRRLALVALRSRGYLTLEAFDGESGFGAFVSNQHNVDLVLTDVAMPVLSGPAMVERILKLEPAVKVMFMTGTPDTIQSHSLEGKSYHVLPKPFTAERLASSVERCLEVSFEAGGDSGGFAFGGGEDQAGA